MKKLLLATLILASSGSAMAASVKVPAMTWTDIVPLSCGVDVIANTPTLGYLDVEGVPVHFKVISNALGKQEANISTTVLNTTMSMDPSNKGQRADVKLMRQGTEFRDGQQSISDPFLIDAVVQQNRLTLAEGQQEFEAIFDIECL